MICGITSSLSFDSSFRTSIFPCSYPNLKVSWLCPFGIFILLLPPEYQTFFPLESLLGLCLFSFLRILLYHLFQHLSNQQISNQHLSNQPLSNQPLSNQHPTNQHPSNQ